MICTDDDSSLLLIAQTDHAHLAKELLTLWQHQQLLVHPRREELLFAVGHHDNGWQEADSAPRLHPDGDRPHDFLSMPTTTRCEIWERGTHRHLASHPYAALLITEHALHLLREPPAADATARECWQQTTERLQQRRTELLEQSGLNEPRLAADYGWLRLADLISLVGCGAWPAPVTCDGVSVDWRPPRLLLAPFPFAGTTSFRVACRRLQRRPYRGDAELGGELAAASWQTWTVRAAPL